MVAQVGAAVAVNWYSANSTGEAIDESKNPQRFPGEIEDAGFLVYYKKLTILAQPRKRPGLPKTQAPRDAAAPLAAENLAYEMIDAQERCKTFPLAQGLRLPAEMTDMSIWAPERWTGRGKEWNTAFDNWRSRLGFTCAPEHALTIHRRCKLTATLLEAFKPIVSSTNTTTGGTPVIESQYTKEELEPLFGCFCDLAIAYLQGHLHTTIAERLREKFSTMWAEGRVNLPAAVGVALHTPIPRADPPKPPTNLPIPTQTAQAQGQGGYSHQRSKGRGGGRGGGRY